MHQSGNGYTPSENYRRLNQHEREIEALRDDMTIIQQAIAQYRYEMELMRRERRWYWIWPAVLIIPNAAIIIILVWQ